MPRARKPPSNIPTRKPRTRKASVQAPPNTLTNDQIANKLIPLLGNQAPPKSVILIALKNPDLRAKLLKSLNTTQKYVIGIGGRREISENLYTKRAPGSCAFGRLQIGGTCWFQAILNGFILSDVGREFMKLRLNQFKQSHEMKKFTNINACPMRGKLPVYFWSYVEHMINAIEKPNSVNNAFNKNVQAGRQFGHNNLIRNIGLRGAANSTEGGTKADLIKFLKSVYSSKGVEDYDSTYELQKDYKNHIVLSNKITTVDRNHILSHADITMYKSTETEGHLVCGYFCEQIKKYVIFDSNYIKPVELDWVHDETALKMYYIDKYSKGSRIDDISIYRKGVYFNKSVPVPSPPWKMMSNENIVKDIFGNSNHDNFAFTKQQTINFLKDPKLYNTVLEEYETYKNKRNANLVNKFMPIGKLYGMNFPRDQVVKMAKTNASFRAKMNSVIKAHERQKKMQNLLNKAPPNKNNRFKGLFTRPTENKKTISDRFKGLFTRKKRA